LKQNIQFVPCIVILYNDGKREFLEAKEAYAWTHAVTSKIKQMKSEDANNVLPQPNSHPQPHSQPHSQPRSMEQVPSVKKVRFQEDEEKKKDMNTPSILKPGKVETKNIMRHAQEMARMREQSIEMSDPKKMRQEQTPSPDNNKEDLLLDFNFNDSGSGETTSINELF